MPGPRRRERVTEVNRNAALVVGALAGAAAALFLKSRAPAVGPGTTAVAGQRADELRQKLAEARETAAVEEEFEAAGMGAETIVEEPPSRRPPAGSPPPAPAASQADAPADEFEAMRRRVHEEGRAAAEEMRREPGADDA